MKLPMKNSRRAILATVGIILGVTGYRLFKQPSGDNTTRLAPLAETRLCGAPLSDAAKESDLIKDWIVSDEDLSSSAKSSLAHTISALPLGITKSFAARGIRIAFGQDKEPFSCGSPNVTQQFGKGSSCIKQLPDYGEVLILAPMNVENSEGNRTNTSLEERIDRALMPALFWTTTEYLWAIPKRATLTDSEPHLANRFEAAKTQVARALKFSSDEQDFYRRDFGASGTENPQFATRSVTLLSAALYCDALSYSRLAASQPDAVKIYMSTFGCALGKPWHMADAAYKSLCLIDIATAGKDAP